MSILRGKKLVLGLTGGIALYKSATLLRRLTRDYDCDVTVVMTRSAQEFMTPLIFETFSGREVITDMFKSETDIVGTRHIDITQSADLVAIIPATANIIGKISSGIADDALSTMLLVAEPKKTVIAPAMNKNMYLNAVVQENLQHLRQLNYHIIEPETGELATAEEGWGIGRLPDEKTLLLFLEKALSSQKKTSLLNKRVLITGGPTREAIDDVRFISNPSTGKMGIALAETAASAGAIVNYVSGPTTLPNPIACKTTHVISANEMKDAILNLYDDQDIVIMTAAVEDIKPKVSLKGKIKKNDIPESIDLEKTDDILYLLGQKKKDQVLVGFSVEVENELENSINKMKKKNLDWIVINNPGVKGSGFAGDTNKVTIVDKDHQSISLPLQSKKDIAEDIWQTLFNTKD
jgi:phosphopantothenoylcysteine decarboxylase / phosphopantothenate---cysteine ligase